MSELAEETIATMIRTLTDFAGNDFRDAFKLCRAVIAAHEAARPPTPDSGDLGGASVQVSDAANRASADARDAARYRYLRDVSTATWMSFQEQWRMPQGMCDAIVDRQMEKQVSESSGGLSADMPNPT